MQVGYVRVSTAEQNTARQEVLMCELGVDRVFIDRASGENADRSELKKLLEFVCEGDAVIVESISRFVLPVTQFGGEKRHAKLRDWQQEEFGFGKGIQNFRRGSSNSPHCWNKLGHNSHETICNKNNIELISGKA